MTTPASNTPNGVIFDAMQDAGLLEDGDEPTGEQYAKYMRRLRDLVNLYQTQGLKLWVNVDTAVTLVSGQASYTLMPSGDVNMTKPLRVIQAYYLDVNSIRRPLLPLSWDDYIRLGQVTQLGAINSYFVDKQATSLVVKFWLTPDATTATGTAHLLLQGQITNPTNLTETMNFPEEWRIALHWGLADDICTGQPKEIMDRCASRAGSFRKALEDWDVEDAPTQFTPDSRMAASYGRFR